MVILFLIAGFFIYAVIGGIVQYRKTPKPPEGSDYQYNKWWYGGGWKEVQAEQDRQRVEEEQQIALQKQIITYLQSGKKMDAIKVYKDYYECSLSKAKTAISEIEWELDYERYHESEDPRPYAHGRAQTSDVEIHSVFDIDRMEGHDFEYFCADLLRKNGFSDVKVTPGSGDKALIFLL